VKSRKGVSEEKQEEIAETGAAVFVWRIKRSYYAAKRCQ